LKAKIKDLENKISELQKEVESSTSTTDSLKTQLETAEAAKAKLREDQASFEANLKAELQQKATKEIAMAMDKAHKEVAETMKRMKSEQKNLEKKYLKEQAMRRKFYNELEDLKGKIRVFCRVRPLSGSEKKRGCEEAVKCADEYSIGLKYELRGRAAKADFEFDRVFPNQGEGSSQVRE
jgi:chromosome segregation ATPase